MIKKSKSMLLRDKMFYSAYIISTEVNKSKKGQEFVEYIIKINILYYNWIIKRRFSDFNKLHSKLNKLLPDLPSLPNKRVFFNCSKFVIKQRIEEFDAYLYYLIQQDNLHQYEEIVTFLEISKEIIDQISFINNTVLTAKDTIEVNSNDYQLKHYDAKSGLESTASIYINKQAHKHSHKNGRPFNQESKQCKKEYLLDSQSSTSSSSPIDRKANYNYFNNNSFCNNKIKLRMKAKTFLYTKIEQFLNDLNSHRDDMTNTIKAFEQFIIEDKQWPRFNRQEILLLFKGDIENNIKGIFYYIGLIEVNYLGAQWCLRFLFKLLNYELNPYCDEFTSLFKTIPIEFLEQMHLNLHIETKSISVIEDSFMIIRVYMENNISAKAFSFLIKDEKLYDQWIEWMMKV